MPECEAYKKGIPKEYTYNQIIRAKRRNKYCIGTFYNSECKICAFCDISFAANQDRIRLETTNKIVISLSLDNII